MALSWWHIRTYTSFVMYSCFWWLLICWLCNWIRWFVSYSHATIEYLHIHICVYCHWCNGPFIRSSFRACTINLLTYIKKTILINARMGVGKRLLQTLAAYWCVICVCVHTRMATYIGGGIWCVLVIFMLFKWRYLVCWYDVNTLVCWYVFYNIIVMLLLLFVVMLHFICSILSYVHLSIVYIDGVFNVHNDVRWAAEMVMAAGVVRWCWLLAWWWAAGVRRPLFASISAIADTIFLEGEAVVITLHTIFFFFFLLFAIQSVYKKNVRKFWKFYFRCSNFM